MSEAIFKKFVTAINQHQLGYIEQLITEKHVFTDPYGLDISGSDAVLKNWKNYFERFPDVHIYLEELATSGSLVLASGTVSGTGKETQSNKGISLQKHPSAWKARMDKDRISHWQVYACTSIAPDNLVTPQEKTGTEQNKNSGRVTGVGGIFFKCQDPERLKAWYQQHLGMTMDTYGTSFEWRQAGDERLKGFTAWSPFKENTTYFEPSKKEFMVNYRVDHLEKLLYELKAAGITICDSVETFDYGKFVHIMDPEGNKIELWEANDDEYDKMIEVRTR